MTIKEFKIKYPEYAHLEGDNLCNIMAEVSFFSTDVKLPISGKIYEDDKEV